MILRFLLPKLTWNIKTNEKVIYLTFDDGPLPEITNFVLEQLNNYKAKATFFCVGDNVSKHPAIFNQIISNGHVIGNHTFNHLKGWQTKDPIYFENIAKSEELYQNQMKKTSELFRPPYGRIKKSQSRELLKKYRIIMWDVLTCDYSAKISPEKCLKRSISKTIKGSIVVFHDSYKAEKNLRYVLPKYLEHFHNQGFEFKSL
ncbi:MAG: polysaccharide deacetylase family protein [Bacteroidota bacterium]|nr:polysaccharide deacetylase family protein [Bacteroidota bacterium]